VCEQEERDDGLEVILDELTNIDRTVRHRTPKLIRVTVPSLRGASG
jgi:hypothetical protein